MRLRALTARLRDVDDRGDPLRMPALADVLGALRDLGRMLGDADAARAASSAK